MGGRMRALAALLLLLATPVAWIAAQSVAPGQRVRLIYTHATKGDTLRTIGTLISWDTTVVLARGVKPTTAADTVRVPAAALTLVEVSLRRKSREGRGALLGAVAGGVAGALVGAMTHEDYIPSDVLFGGCLFASSEAEAIAGGVLILGAAGTLVGLVIGSLVKTDEWRVVPLPKTALRLEPTPQGSVALTFAVRW